jgi:hypothetical protein
LPGEEKKVPKSRKTSKNLISIFPCLPSFLDYKNIGNPPEEVLSCCCFLSSSFLVLLIPNCEPKTRNFFSGSSWTRPAVCHTLIVTRRVSISENFAFEEF